MSRPLSLPHPIARRESVRKWLSVRDGLEFVGGSSSSSQRKCAGSALLVGISPWLPTFGPTCSATLDRVARSSLRSLHDNAEPIKATRMTMGGRLPTPCAVGPSVVRCVHRPSRHEGNRRIDPTWRRGEHGKLPKKRLNESSTRQREHSGPGRRARRRVSDRIFV